MSQELKCLIELPEITVDDLKKNVSVFQELRDDFERHQLLGSSEFFSDKIIALLDDDPNNQKLEIYKYSKMLFRKGEYHRAASLLEKKHFHSNDLSCRHLLANCLYFSREYQSALNVLRTPGENVTFVDEDGSFEDWKSSIELLKGRLYQKVEQFAWAKQCFLKALYYNINSYEAFKELVSYDAITKEEENILLEILDVKESDVDSPESMIKYVYLSELDKNDKFKKRLDALSNQFDGLLCPPNESIHSIEVEEGSISKVVQDSADFKLNHAEKRYLAYDFVGCLNELANVINEDEFNQRALLLVIGCHLELDNKVELYSLGHRLVKTYSETALSWYAVGCYYYRIQNIEAARKHFEKSVTFDLNFYPTMLMMGHLYELQSLHDKSLQLYLDLSKLMVNSHLPFLYAGVEYVHTSNYDLGEKYILKALEFAPDDPIVLHELGNLYYEKKMFNEAFERFTQVYDIIKSDSHFSDIPLKWEPLLNNLGHVSRELHKYELALEYHQSAIKLKPSCSSFIALGFVQYKMGNIQLAAQTFDQALSIDCSNVLASTLWYSAFFPDEP